MLWRHTTPKTLDLQPTKVAIPGTSFFDYPQNYQIAILFALKPRLVCVQLAMQSGQEVLGNFFATHIKQYPIVHKSTVHLSGRQRPKAETLLIVWAESFRIVSRQIENVKV